MGKGSKRRPTLVPFDEFANNFDRVFGRKGDSDGLVGERADSPEEVRPKPGGPAEGEGPGEQEAVEDDMGAEGETG